MYRVEARRRNRRPRTGLSFALLLCAGLLTAISSLAARAAEPIDLPLLVTYGLEAPSREGDPTHRQVIYIELPDSLTERVYLRVFDPDVGGDHDLMYGAPNSQTRFALFGGDGAYAGDDATGRGNSDAEISGGRLLAEKTFGDDPRTDGQWITIALITPSDGEKRGDKRVFRLLVDGIAGNDANLYGIALSLRERRVMPPEGARFYSYAPTIRVPNRSTLTELRFQVPDTETGLRIDNFDAAHGRLFLSTAFRSVRLKPSGQDQWRSETVELQPEERGQPAAITLQGGREIPNDATFYITVKADHLLPLELPPFNWIPNNRPEIHASATFLDGCRAIAFDASQSTDADGDRLSYTWRFSDNTVMTGPTVVKDYDLTGRFRERLEVRDNSGQIGNGSAEEFEVYVKRPPVARISAPAIVATGESVLFNAESSSSASADIAHFDWRFNDGTRAQGPKVARVFESPGDYLVALTVTDNSGHPCDNHTIEIPIRVNAQPVAEAGSDRRTEIGTRLSFDGQRSYDRDGQITSYRWDTGDGTVLSGKSVGHAFEAPGNYEVALTVEDDAGVANSTDVDTANIIVNAPPVPVAGEDLSVAIGDVVEFDGSLSSDADGTIISYDWDFGDGTTASGPRVTYAFAAPGTYTVRLSVTDDSGTRSRGRSDTLQVRVNAPPVARAGPDQTVTASAVRFNGTNSTDADDLITEYLWDFGDGATGSGPSPSHVYRKPGLYTVRLTVTDGSGTARNTATDTMQVVVNTPPIADAGPDLIGAPGEELIFQASRSVDPDGDITGYEWDFKDGTIAEGEIVAHTFDKPGRYFVRLKVTDNTGHMRAIDYDETEVFINTPPIADAGDDLRVAPGEVFTLTGNRSTDSDGVVTDYRWDVTGLAEPVYQETLELKIDEPGTYTALLTISDDSGADNSLAEDSVTIRVNHQPSAEAGSDVFTAKSLIIFDGGASSDPDGDGLTYTWDFGDGTTATGAQVAHNFTAGGSYPVILTVSDGTGLANATAVDELRVTINNPPVAVAGENQRLCTGDILVLDGGNSSDPDGGVLKYAWDFGDGSTSDIVNPTKTYRRGGVYPITLTVTDDSGLGNAIAQDQIAVTVDQAPVAEAGPDIRICANTEVTFDGSKSWDADGVVNRYQWDFGDGGSSGGDKPKHIYRRAGTYRAQLTIEGDRVGQCDIRARDEVLVEVTPAPVPLIDAKKAVPVGVPVRFDGSRSYLDGGEVTAWSWDFGDRQTGESKVQEHTFTRPGTYRVALTVDSSAESQDCRQITAYHLITVNAPPVANAGEDIVVGVNEQFILDGSASTDPEGALSGYAWNLGDGTTLNGVVVRHRFAQAGRYDVKLTVTDTAELANSSATDTVTVIVHDGVTAALEAPDSVCVGEEFTLSAARSSSPEVPITRFAWAFGDGTTANSEKVTKRYASPGLYNVSVLVDDGMQRASSQREASKVILVNRPPLAIAGPDRRACPGVPVRFDASASSDPDGKVSRIAWDFGDGATGDGATPEHVFQTPGTYDVTLRVTDDSGSSCAIQEDRIRVVVNTPPTADAGPDREVFVGGANDAEVFSAWRSFDPDGTDLAHVWDFGPDGQRSGERVAHTFSSPGDYEVRLTVSDGSGLSCGTASDTITVKVRSREVY
jgi:PKD repeat protein